MPKTAKKKKFQYSPYKMQQAIEAVTEGMPVLKACKEFKVPRTTLRNKLEGKSPRESTGHCGYYSYLGEENEKAIEEWILDCAKMGFPIDRDGLLSSVQRVVQELKLDVPFANGRPGKTWYYAFLNRHKQISRKKAEYIHGGRGAVTEEKIRKWFEEVKLSLADKTEVLSDPTRVFNMDESGFALAPKTGVILGPRGKSVYDERTVSDKENLTVLFSVDAAGTFAPPLAIFKYERIPPSVANMVPKEWGLGKSKNGWMTSDCFYEYFTNVFMPFLKNKNIKFPVIVFVDGHRSHLTLHLSRFCRDNQIILIALQPNATHILQPLDVAVFGPLKVKWKDTVRKFKIDNNGKEITRADVPRLLSQIIKDPKMINNIKSGFRATGLYPFSPEAVDYNKIIVRKPTQPKNIDIPSTVINEHLLYLESKIDVNLLDEFKLTRRRGHDWEGADSASELYKVWVSVANDVSQSDSNTKPDGNDLTTIFESDSDDASETPTPQQSSVNISETEPEASTSTKPNNVKLENIKRNIFVTPKTSPTAFKNILPWPEPKVSTNLKRKKEYTPSVVTADTWVAYHEEKEKSRLKNEETKKEKQRQRDLRQAEASKKKIKKTMEKMETSSSSSGSEDISVHTTDSDEISWYSPDIEAADILLPSDQPIKPGDFVLVRFSACGKRKSTTYRYLTTVRQVTENDLEIQCLKSTNKEKTRFEYIENDISTIFKTDVLGMLPEPALVEEGRKLIAKFPGFVDVLEKP